MFGKDKDQDKQINEIWKWLETLNKNQAIIIKNQNVLVKNNQYFIESLQALRTKDSQHDATDKQIMALIDGLKNMAKSVEAVKEE